MDSKDKVFEYNIIIGLSLGEYQNSRVKTTE